LLEVQFGYKLHPVVILLSRKRLD